MNYPETAEEFLGSADIVNIWKMKYALPDEVHPRDTYKRVAHELYLQLLEDHDNTPILKELGIISEEQLYQLFIDRIIVPQGRPMLGLGNPDYVSVSNCVVTGAPKDSYEDIIATRYRMVELYKRGMGCGFHINNLRPKGLKVTNSSKFATGPASFVNGFSNTTLEVAQLGRRGALMVMINARHPDAEEFIRLKAEDENYCSGANLSVQIEDDFWDAAKNNQQYIQKWPIDVELTGPEVEYIDSRPLGELVLLREGKAAARRIEAKKLWDLIIYCAWKKAEPGIILWTRQHKYSISSVYPKYVNSSTNPCFIGTTMVAMSDGTFKQIKDVKEGDLVKSVNIKTGKTEDKKVLWSGKTGTKPVINVNGESCTKDHKWFDPVLNKFDEPTNIKFVRKDKCNTYVDEPFKYFKDLFNQVVTDQEYLNSKFESKEQLNELKVKYNFHGNSRYWRLLRQYVLHENPDNLPLDELDDFIKEQFNKGYGRKKIARDLGVCKSLVETYMYARGFFGLQANMSTGRLNQTRRENAIKLSSRARLGASVARALGIRIGNRTENWGTRSTFNIVKFRDKFYYSKSFAEYKYLMYLLYHNIPFSQEPIVEIPGVPNHRADFKVGEEYIEIKDQWSIETCSVYLEIKLVRGDEFELFGKFTEIDCKQNLFLDHDENVAYDIEKVSIDTNEGRIEDVYDITVEDNHNFFANGYLVHNCSEIAMQEYDTCRLFAVNLSKFVCNPFEDSAKIDFDYLYKMCAINQVLCDALVSVEIKRLTRIKEKIQSDQGLTQNEINLSCELYDNLIKSAHEGRRTGCGYLGLVDMYTELGWVYGDTRIEQVFKTKCKAEFDASILLARYHKPFDGFDRSVEEKSDFIKMMKADPYFEDTLKNMFKYGRRNVSLSTVAPTGTVSLIAGCNGGIEPYFRLRYKRRVKLNEEQPGCYRDSEGILWIDTWREEPMYKLFKEKYAGKPNVNSSFIYEVFEANTSDKISLDDRIRVQSISQKYITHSISSTVNLPNQATVEDVELIYRKAHDAGLKGVTVYRDGCRTGVLISEETDNKRKLNIATKFKRPKSLEAEVIRYKNQGEKWVAIISLFEGKPIEIFTESEENMGFVGLTVDKGQVIRTKGKDINRYDFVYTLGEPGEEKLTIPNITSNLGEYSNYARLLSGLLKYGVPVEQVYFTIDGLKFENEDITSWKTGIKRVLKKYIKDGVEYKGEVCPNCGGKMIFKDGCAMCESCGWSKCG